MTPKEEKVLIDTLRERFKDESKAKELSFSGLPEEMQQISFDKMVEFYSKDEKFRDVWNRLVQQVGEEKALRLADSFLIKGNQYTGDGVEIKKADPEAFYSVKAPPTKPRSLYAFDFQMEERGGPKGDSNKILEQMSPAEREKFIKKLDLPARWEDGELIADVPNPKRWFNVYLQRDKFLDRAEQVLNLPAKKAGVNKEELIENIVEVLDKEAQQAAEHYADEQYVVDSYGEYTTDDARNRSFSDMIDNLDDDIKEYVEKLQELEVDEDDITKMLIESAEDEYTDSHYTSTNSIGSFLSDGEEELEIQDDWFNDASKFPYPGDLDANLELLDDEDIEKIRRGMSEGSVRFRKNEKTGTWTTSYMYCYPGQRGVELIVKDSKFISKAKRVMKDKKLERKRSLKDEKLQRRKGA